MSDNCQKSLIDSLHDLSLYPHETGGFEMIETHISWIFLCGPYAYKIKKAVNLGFLDLTEKKKRKYFCEEELRLNGRLAPELYLQVIPITGTCDRPQLAGSGEVLEYAVKMRRFPGEALLSKMLKKNTLKKTHVDQLIGQVADFHQRIPAAADSTRYGDPEHVRGPVSENFIQIRKSIQDPRHVQLLHLVSEWEKKEHRLRYVQFQERKVQGFIRECHGDMHLGNIAIINDRPVIFDGIEFNADLYWIDVMSEVAFLCMDLESKDKRDFAFRFLNGYLELTGDYAGLQVFAYYQTYRAMVRAKVAGIRLSQKDVHEFDQGPDAQEFESYLKLALSYTRPEQPVMLITHGLSGSGKSTLSSSLTEEMGLIRVRSDRERQRLFGKGKKKGEMASVDQDIYSSEATLQTYSRLAELAGLVLDSGHSVIIDATFLKQSQRDAFKEFADRNAVPFRILYFQAGAEELRRRVRERQHQGQDISEADINVLEHQLSSYSGLREDEQSYTVTIDTGSCQEAGQISVLVRQSLGFGDSA